MKHIQTFESFLNETNGLDYWKDYEVDTSNQSDPKMANKCTSQSEVTKCIEDAIQEWYQESEENELSFKDKDKINDLAMKFFKKFNYINGNIVLAMIMQETK